MVGAQNTPLVWGDRESGPDLIFLSDSDDELAAIAKAHARLGADAPTLSLQKLDDREPPALGDAPADFLRLPRAKLIIARVPGDRDHHEHHVRRLVDAARHSGALLAIFAKEQPRGDEWLWLDSSIPEADYGNLTRCFARGGPKDIARALEVAIRIINRRKRGKPSGFVATVGGATLGVAAFAAGAFAWLQMQVSSFVTPKPREWPAAYDDPTDFTLTFPELQRYLSVTPAPAEQQKEGRFAYGAPSVMVAGEPYFLSLAISAPRPGETIPQIDLRLEQDTRDTLGAEAPAATGSGNVRLGAEMTAELIGDNFGKLDLTEARQSVDLMGGVTRWLWEVRGKEPGRSSLVMRLTLHEAGGTKDTVVRVIPAIVDVRAEADAFLTKDQMSAKTPGAQPNVQAGPREPANTNTLMSPQSSASSGKCTSTGPESRKLALVIGNDAYTGIAPLTYARADSDLMRDVLVESGFRVTHCEDLDADQLSGALDTFAADVKRVSAGGETTAAFYYSGHGASTPSQNETYLLPISLRQATVDQIEAHGFAVGQVVGGLSRAGARRLIVVIDACRDVLRLEDGDFRGFRRLNWRTAAYDIVGYATMWGEKARDNGLYARSLAESIRALPDADISAVLNEVQNRVSAASGGDQVPQYDDRMPGVFTFRNLSVPIPPG
jgi:hypothetical protein